MMRLRRDKYESNELCLAAIGDAVILSSRREHDFAGAELALFIPHRKHAFAFEHVVDFILAAMSVQALLLARLEAIGVAEETDRFRRCRSFSFSRARTASPLKAF